MSRGLRLATWLVGFLLLALALAMFGYTLASGARLTDLGWLIVIGFGVAGGLLLRRSMKWNEARYCPRCGEQVSRDLSVCTRCGFNFDAVTWAVIGKFKLP